MATGATVVVPREPAIDLIRVISEGTYTTFAQALKEFVSNAYDADATRLEITIDEDCSLVQIRDNGVGMQAKDFVNYYASLARSGASGATSVSGRTRRGRRKIGRFGLGALAVIGIADRFVVRSSKAGKREGFEAAIDLTNVRKNFRKNEDLSKHWKFRLTTWDNEPVRRGFTDVRIEGLKNEVQAALQQPGQKSPTDFVQTVDELSGIEALRWRLGLICPAAYVSGYPLDERRMARGADSILRTQVRKLNRADFAISLNGSPALRQITLPSYRPSKLADPERAKLLLRRGLGFELRCFSSRPRSGLRYQGYVLSQAMQVFPEEVRGILVRIRGVAVGWHRMTYVPTNAPNTFPQTVSGEVWVEGLDDALQFDRESFREDHPLYVRFREELASFLYDEGKDWRDRSVVRRKKERGKAKQAKAKAPRSRTVGPVAKGSKTAPEEAKDEFLPLDVFSGQPEYILRIVRQISGCWNRDYREACGTMIRRVLETMIIEYFECNKWKKDLIDKSTGDYISFGHIIGKLGGDAKHGMEARVIKALKDLKGLGDVSAHDFRVKIRKSDFTSKKDMLRYTADRLLYFIARAKE